MNSSAAKKRIGIYIFNDIYGVSDRYVDYFLQDFSGNVDTLIIAANGNTSSGSLEKLKKYSQHIVTSEKNTGFINLTGSALKYINQNGIQSYDEIILTNSDIYGPLVSMKNVLSCMDVVKSDFFKMAAQTSIQKIIT